MDIHGGGFDLRFPHHDNELAQSEVGKDSCLARKGHDVFPALLGRYISSTLRKSLLMNLASILGAEGELYPNHCVSIPVVTA